MFTSIQDDAVPRPLVGQHPVGPLAVEDHGPPPRGVALEDSRVVRLADQLASLEVAQRQGPAEPDVVLAHVRRAAEVLVDVAAEIAEGPGTSCPGCRGDAGADGPHGDRVARSS